MDDSSDLQARIARLAGRINRHKTAESTNPPTRAGYSASRRLPAPSMDRLLLNDVTLQEHSHGWVPQRGTPYGVQRGRGWNARPPTHRNRTLIVNASQQEPGNQTTAKSKSAQPSGPNETPSAAGWVTKHDRHMQLINNTVYEQKTQERTRAMEETRRQRALAREDREKSKINNHLQAVAASQHDPTSTPQNRSAHQIIVNDIRFVVADGGSKLIKAQDEHNLSLPTPKRANIGGVTFHRSRHGNLYRAGLVRTMRSDYLDMCATSAMPANNSICSRAGISKISEPCPQFSTTGTIFPHPPLYTLDQFAPLTPEAQQVENQLMMRTGSCAKGPQCRYVHDPSKVAICRDFLQTGKCQAGDDCDLSHDPTPERVPACLHFLRGNCTNTECRYAHVRTNPGAPVCRAFATLGYCAKGAECAERHVHECPDYANKGICRNSKCRLPHVDRAGQLRKAAANETVALDEDPSSDVSSDAGLDSDDVDSDEFDEDMLMQTDADNNHELSQQVDYVQL